MSKLLPVTFACLILGLLSHWRSRRSEDRLHYDRKEAAFWFVATVIMILFVGLRTTYNDTYIYRYSYETTNISVPLSQAFSWKLGSNPGYNVVRYVLASLGFPTQSYLMFYSAITVGVYMWFLRKYSTNLWLTAFLFLTIGCFTFTLAAIKQCVAVAFCLLATDRALRGRYLAFVLWILLGSLFHPYALMYLLVPLLFFEPWTWKTWLMLALFCAAGILLQPLMGTVIDITTIIGEGFTEESLSGSGVNPFRLAVVAVPVVLSFITRRVIADRKDRIQNLMLNLTMLNAAIMFVALFGTANYFARLANYFLIFQCISIPWLLTQFERRTRLAVTVGALGGYAAYFYYANAINQRFDGLYASISLGDYLSILLQSVK